MFLACVSNSHSCAAEVTVVVAVGGRGSACDDDCVCWYIYFCYYKS